jgi:hypothetical protein
MRSIAGAKISQEKTVIQRQIEARAQEIDQLVYELYELTDAEVRILSRARGTSTAQQTS